MNKEIESFNNRSSFNGLLLTSAIFGLFVPIIFGVSILTFIIANGMGFLGGVLGHFSEN